MANPNPDFFSYTMAKNALAASVATLGANVAGNADIPAQFLFPESSRAPDDWTRIASLLSIAAGNAFHQRLFGVGRAQPIG